MWIISQKFLCIKGSKLRPVISGEILCDPERGGQLPQDLDQALGCRSGIGMGEESTGDGVIVIWEDGTEYRGNADSCGCRTVMSLYNKGE